MNYKIREIELKNNQISRTRTIIEFEDESDAIVAEFLMADAALLNYQVIKDVEAILAGEKEEIQSVGNRTKITIRKSETIIEDTFDDEYELEAVCLDTKDFQALLKEWFQMRERHN